MALAVVNTRTQVGVRALPVSVEVHIANGLPAFIIVGLPETVVKESKERVRSALLNSHFAFPDGRITVNLAPADIPKEGGRFDLPIAIGILIASGQLSAPSLEDYEFAAELALDGSLRSVPGALPFALEAQLTHKKLILSKQNIAEATAIKAGQIYPADHLLEVTAHLQVNTGLSLANMTELKEQAGQEVPDLADVKGQQQAKRALEIAAAGGHNLLLLGSPGTGKTMLAMRLPGILPPMTEAEVIQTAAIYSIRGLPFIKQGYYQRPFRQPHHTSSSVALVGGGSQPKPGEISLAHHGVLFLDELPEFDRKVLEVLREPIESGVIHIARAKQQLAFPAHFQLIAAMNPCPCGYLGSAKKSCRCRVEQIKAYHGKISGPLLDRIDLHVEVSELSPALLFTSTQPVVESSLQVRQRVVAARGRQLTRQGKTNASLNNKELEVYCSLARQGERLLGDAAQNPQLSARAAYRVLKVARTIADLESAERISTIHLAEALGYRDTIHW